MNQSPAAGFPIPTRPDRTGAPLPDGIPIVEPGVEAMKAELTRATVELMYAIARHRKAWAAMRSHKERREAEAERRGTEPSLDSDPLWKLRTGDVSWWRDEMNAQASVVSALYTLLHGEHDMLNGWREITSVIDLNRGHRVFIHADAVTWPQDSGAPKPPPDTTWIKTAKL